MRLASDVLPPQLGGEHAESGANPKPAMAAVLAAVYMCLVWRLSNHWSIGLVIAEFNVFRYAPRGMRRGIQ